jgi:PAS domain S-box-containing protein
VTPELLGRQGGPSVTAELVSWIPSGPLGFFGLAFLVLGSVAIGVFIQRWFAFQSSGRPVPLSGRPEAGSAHPNESQLRQLLDVVPALIFCADPDGEPSYVNKPLIDYVGLTVDDFASVEGPRHIKAIASLIHPDDRTAVEQAWARSFSTGEPWAALYRQRRADGDYRWTDGRATPLRGPDGGILQWIGVCLDIDEQVRSKESLEARETELTRLIETVPSLIWSLNPDGQPAYFSNRLVEWFGLDVSDLDTPDQTRLAATISTVVHPDDAAGVDEALAEALQTGHPFHRRYRLRRRSGDYRWIEARAEPLHDASGEIIQWYGVCLDIDDSMRTQNALRERELELIRLIDTVPSLIWSMNTAGQPTYFNRRLNEWLGLGVEDLDGNNPNQRYEIISQIVHPEWRERAEEGIRDAIARGESFTGKFPHRNAAGDYRWTESKLEPLRDDEGRIVYWYGVLVDIEDEVRAQEALLTAQERLARATQAASLAELSASIAHELNQPLSAIISNAEACQRWLASEPPNLERALMISERIIRHSNTASDVVNGIRALFRQGTQPKSPVNVQGVIVEVRDLMAAELRTHGAVLSMEVEDDLPDPPMDRVQIQQVLVNLVRNGVEASEPSEGRTVITAIARRKNKAEVQVEVVDRGGGVTDPDRMFEAFFTTKTTGMGMGLAICRSVIEAHQGRLWAERVEPRGTRMVFTLPLAECE